MSKITQKPAVGAISPFIAPTTNTGNTNYTGTATPAVTYEAFSAVPATGAQPATGTGFYDPNFCTYVGQKFETSDGRELVLVVNGGVAIGAGLLCQAPAQITAFQGLAITVPTATPATAGSTQVLVTNGSTVLNVNAFQGGYFVTASGTGLGQTLKMSSHQAAANGGKFIVTLEDALQTTLDATTTVHLVQNPYGSLGVSGTTSQGIIVNPTTGTGVPIGVTVTPLAASTVSTYSGTTGALTANGVAQYGLIQCKGPIAILQDADGATVGYPIGASDLTAGAVGIATLTTQPQIGIAMQTETSAQYGMVYLQL